MTEAGWLNGSDHGEMIDYVQESAKGRQVRLLCLACCRRVWGYLTDVRSRAAVEAMEIEVERPDSPLLDELQTPRPHVWLVARSATVAVSNADTPLIATRHASETVVLTAAGYTGEPLGTPLNAAIHAACEALQEAESRVTDVDFDDTDTDEEAAQRELMRDIFGNPFRPVTFSAEWRTETAVALARQMYESREFGAMPILADALQDAGCDDADILNHCRGDGPHVRGCWVVDLVLGKE